MQEALQEDKVINKLNEKGYEPGLYVYGVTEPKVSIGTALLFGIFAGNQPKSFVLNFTEKGIAFLELNSMNSQYTDLHTFISVDQIKEITFKKGLFIYTLKIISTDGSKQIIKISGSTMGVKWQKGNVIKLVDFLGIFRK